MVCASLPSSRSLIFSIYISKYEACKGQNSHPWEEGEEGERREEEGGGGRRREEEGGGGRRREEERGGGRRSEGEGGRGCKHLDVDFQSIIHVVDVFKHIFNNPRNNTF